MIALHLRWGRESGPPRDSISASLGLANGGVVGAFSTENAVLSSTVPTQKHSRGWRPARHRNGGFVLFNGYIDNRSSLRTALSVPQLSDAELYAAAHAEWGNAADLRINGRYCCAIVDEAGQSVRIARSPLQAPPLHIWRNSEQLIVASTPRIIFATGLVEQRVDDQKIADSFLINLSEEGRSWFQDVSRLPINSRALINRDGIRIERYYDPLAVPAVRLARDEEYVEAARGLLDDATRAALQDFKRPAISISGGLDSQAVAALAIKNLEAGTILRGFTGIPEAEWHGNATSDELVNERSYVEAFAEMYPQFHPEWVTADGLSFDHKIDQFLLVAGVPPLAANNMPWLHEVWSRAKSNQCDVMLTGAMGNVTFSTWCPGIYLELFKSGKWLKMLRELHAIRRDGKSWAYEFAARVVAPSLPDWAWKFAMKQIEPARFVPYSNWSPINPEWAKEMHVEERAADIGHDYYFRYPKNNDSLRQDCGGGEEGDVTQAFEQLYGLPSRDPTSYRPLAEFCFGIPDEQYLERGQTRWLARRVLKGLIPEAVRTERRRGLQGADWDLRLGRKKDEVSAEMVKLMRNQSLSRRLNLPSLKATLDRWVPGEKLGIQQEQRLEFALSRGLVTAKFIRYAEGRNDE